MDFAKTIDALDRDATPFLSSLKKVKISNALYQWLEEPVYQPELNAQLEGFTHVARKSPPPNLVTNAAQIFSKTVSITHAENAPEEGKTEVMTYQTFKKARNAKVDLEYSLVGTRQTMVHGGPAIPRVMGGGQALIHQDNIFGTAAFEEDVFLDVIHRMYFNSGVVPTIMLVGSSDYETASKFKCATTGCARCGDGSITLATTFGDVKLVLDRFIAGPRPTTIPMELREKVKAGEITRTQAYQMMPEAQEVPCDAILYRPEDFELLVFRNWSQADLPKLGDAESKMIVGEFSLKLANSRMAAVIRHS